MAYESVRAQLDKLLGPDRNGPLNAAAANSTDYHHSEICKNYLLGFCPADLNIKHRSEPGSCKYRHSDSAKVAFLKDVASLKASREKARWTASLLSECRAILADEDRRVRCHARRLKETYNVQGDVSGLMIQSFETLKKLGMVRKNAQIRVLGEIDDQEFCAAHGSKERTDEDSQPTFRNGASPLKRSSLALPTAEEQKTVSGRENREFIRDKKSNHSFSSETENLPAAAYRVEEEEDFRFIKVIPAADKPSKNLIVQEHSEGESCAHPVPQSFPGHRYSQSSHDIKNSRSGSYRTESRETEEVGRVALEKRKSRKPSTGLGKNTSRSEFKEVSQAKSKVFNNTLKNFDLAGEEVLVLSKMRTLRDGERSSRSDSPPSGTATGREVMKEAENNRMISSSIMDEFYERGVGPDGLLMLDRKQSLRVCACCGGYISLVDAESRLLSHYGGKSHHSMALLRQKVQELEIQVSTEMGNSDAQPRVHARVHSLEQAYCRPQIISKRRYQGHGYSKSPERGRTINGTRGGPGFEDRREERFRLNSRGHGTSDWYNSSLSESGEGQSSHWSERHRNFDGSRQYYGRSFGQKRYRSRSPVGEFRRTRRR